MKNDVIQGQFIFHLEKTCKEEIYKIINTNKEGQYNYGKLDDTSSVISIKYEPLQISFEEFNKLELPTLRAVDNCYPNLKLHGKEALERLEIKVFIPNTIYYFSDYSYFLRIENVFVFNNTEPQGPRVQKPINESASTFVPTLDAFQFISDSELLAARNNNFASEIHADEFKNPYPVVAIIDSGIDLGAFRKMINNDRIAPIHFYKNPCESVNENCCNCKFTFLGFKLNCGCKKQKDNCGCKKSEKNVIGRNFYDKGPYGIYKDHPYDNDGYTKHGTRMAKIIANITNNKVRIMSLKTANHIGEHNVFDIYSAFEYILKYNNNSLPSDKVRIINASWSYCPDFYPIIMKYYIDALKHQGVIFVTTSGNPKEKINDKRRYPALLQKPDDKFIVVTSLEIETINPVHGYSEYFVKNGVIGDQNGEFKEVIKNVEDKKLKGTSYAAAIYSGHIAKGMVLENDDEKNVRISLDGLFNGETIIATDLY